jgi:hypothetical protein
LKSKFSVTIWAAVAAVLLPLASMSQVAKPSGKADSADTAETPTKYEVFLGYGYTSLNQVPGSRYGLMGVTVSGTRDWGKYFGVTVDAGSYGHATNTGNPGDPTVNMFLAGPVIHANIYGKTSVLVHALLGGAHTSGENATPSVSFAGGLGLGMEYSLNRRFAIRAYGDDIFSSFAVAEGTSSTNSGLSPHRRGNSRASVGVVYRF